MKWDKNHIQQAIDLLKQHTDLLETNDLSTLYELAKNSFHNSVSALTEVLYTAGINPLDYFDKSVPDQFARGLEDLIVVNLPEGIFTIRPKAFCRCINLEHVTLPNSIKNIGDYSFYSCKALTEIILPKNLRRIGEYAFYDCYNLSKIIYDGTIEEFRNNVLTRESFMRGTKITCNNGEITYYY